MEMDVGKRVIVGMRLTLVLCLCHRGAALPVHVLVAIVVNEHNASLKLRKRKFHSLRKAISPVL